MSFKSIARVALILGALAYLTACMSTTAMVSEAAYDTLTIVDMGQTVTIARNPQIASEVGPITRNVIGSHPSTKAVYEYMASEMLLHGVVTFLLDRADPGSGPWHTASLLWQGAGIVNEAASVTLNFSQGIDPWAGAIVPRTTVNFKPVKQ